MTRKINYPKMDYQEIVTVLRYTLICIILHNYAEDMPHVETVYIQVRCLPPGISSLF